MFVSYLMQMFIILSAWLLYHFYETWARWPVAVTLIPFHGPRKASVLAKQAQTNLRVSDHAAALVSALDEMQKVSAVVEVKAEFGQRPLTSSIHT